MDEQEQEQAQQAIAEHLREEWDNPQTRERVERPPRWRWPLTGRQTANLIAVVLVIAILVPAGIFGFRLFDAHNALNTATSFCNAVDSSDFTTAYSLLSRRVRSELTQDHMTSGLQAERITACTPGHVPVTLQRNQNEGITGDTDVLDVEYVVNGVGPVNGTMSLHRDDQGWRVDRLQQTDGLFTLVSEKSCSMAS